MTGSDIAMWPSVRDVARELDVSQGYVFQLLHATPPRLEHVKTRIGYLINPSSVAAFVAERTARQRGRSAQHES